MWTQAGKVLLLYIYYYYDSCLSRCTLAIEKTDVHIFWRCRSEWWRKPCLTEKKKRKLSRGSTLLCSLLRVAAVVHSHAHAHRHTRAHLHLPTKTPNHELHGTAYPVSGGGNMSVPAEDELLQQSLEQSLCPNEEDSTDSTPSPTPVQGLGFTFLRICSPTDGTNDFAPCQGKW